jgi:lipopolysaccharide biosynthesis glycosyltransferase
LADDYVELSKWADAAFRAQYFVEARAMYAFLVAQGQGGYFAKLRLADLTRLCDDAPTALKQLDNLRSEPEYDYRSEVVRALALTACGQHGAASWSLETVVAAAPGNSVYVRMLLAAWERDGKPTDLAQAVRIISTLKADEQFELLVRTHMAFGDPGGAWSLIVTHPDEISKLGDPMIAHVIRALTQMGDFEKLAQFVATTNAPDSKSPPVLAALLSSYCEQGAWGEAQILVDATDHILLESGHPGLWTATLHFLCLNFRFEDALELLDGLDSVSDVPPYASNVVADLLVSTGKWDRMHELLADRVERKLPIDERVFLDATQRLARQTGRYAHVVELLNRSLIDVQSTSVTACRDRLLTEVAFFRDLGIEVEPIDVPDRLLRSAWWPALLRDDSNVEAWSAAPVSTISVEAGVFFCTDRKYFVGTCVALWSLLRQNRELRTAWPITVVCGSDILASASEFLDPMSVVAGVDIRILDGATLVPTIDHLRTSWGIFSSSKGLSEAAYYRIFTAQWLLDQGVTGRALYLDSDTLPGPGITRLLQSELQGRPLGARTEMPLINIQRAAEQLGIGVESYFNSGVLLFDLGHHALPGALSAAITFAERYPELLTFVDQCALNVGFAGLRAPLSNECNYFTRAADTEIDQTHRPIVRHYLQSPKPWDPGYESANGVTWRDGFSSLSQVLTPEQRRFLLSLPFTARSRTAP